LPLILIAAGISAAMFLLVCTGLAAWLFLRPSPPTRQLVQATFPMAEPRVPGRPREPGDGNFPRPRPDPLPDPGINFPIQPDPPQPRPDEPQTVPKRESANIAIPKSVAGQGALTGATTSAGEFSFNLLNLAKSACVCWNAEHSAFYSVNGETGAVSRVLLNGLTEQRRLDIGRKSSWVSLSAEGLVVTVTDLQEVWLLDATSLEVKSRTFVPSVRRAVSASGLSVAFASCGGDTLYAVDLKTANAGWLYKGSYGQPLATPDGKYLFAIGWHESQLYRYRINGTKLNLEESGPLIGSGRVSTGICISPDSKYVCYPTGGGNNRRDVPDHPRIEGYGTFVYNVDNIRRPICTLLSGAYPNAVGFDPKQGKAYTQNHDKQLIVFTLAGAKEREYSLNMRGADVLMYLVHPDGGKFLLLTSEKLFWVDSKR